MRGGIGVRSSQLAIAVACIAAAVLIVLIAVHTTPIADDYGDIPQIEHQGVFQYLHSYWLGLTDRYSDAAFMVVMIKLFGAAAIHVATPLLITVLFGFCFVAAQRIGRPDHTRWEAAFVAGVAAIAIASATPSIFDTLGWFNAVAIYLTGVVAAIGTAAWMARVATLKSPPRAFHLVLSFIIGLAAAGFTELIGIVIALGSSLAVANVRAVCAPGPYRRAFARAYAAIAAGAAAGVVVILVGPGSRSRLRYQHGGFNIPRFLDAIRANLPWVGASRWDLFACAAAGLLVFNLRGTRVAPKTARWLFVWCLFMSCVPMFVMDASTAYAGGTVAPPRAAYTATACIGIAVAIFAYVLAATLVSTSSRLTGVLNPAATIAFLSAVVGFGLVTAPVIRAERLRQTALQARTRSIRGQIALHRRAILIEPAPLIIFDTSAFDLRFQHHKQYVWVTEGLRQYYAIPKRTVLRVSPTQPRAYCLDGITVPWAGVQSCQQLSAIARADRKLPVPRARG